MDRYGLTQQLTALSHLENSKNKKDFEPHCSDINVYKNISHTFVFFHKGDNVITAMIK